VARVSAEFPDATHHCWAFVAGPPGTTAQVGLGDAGEPHGTAGRPILNVLLHSEVGEVAAVVSRWFGGVKLGKGGLSRAYGDAVLAALADLPTEERIERVEVTLKVPYRAADRLTRVLAEMGATARQQPLGDGEGVELRADLPVDRIDRLRAGVASITSGAGRVEIRPPEADPGRPEVKPTRPERSV
jgi:uncharacterized YigZ family protein